jgi:hypothetical protein
MWSLQSRVAILLVFNWDEGDKRDGSGNPIYLHCFRGGAVDGGGE